MAFYQLRTEHLLPISIEQAWEFFSNPVNLAKITPPEMNFVITSPPSNSTYPGQIITYTVSPILGIPLKWMTEITQVKAPHYFVDTQLHGPYKFWHHEHHFRQMEKGTEMKDILYYELPFGILGDLAHFLFVRRQVENIFRYRERKLNELFL